MARKFKLIILFIFTSLILHAENRNFTASVYDFETNEPVSKVNVMVINSEIGTITNDRGICSMVLPDNRSDLQIKFSHIAYHDTTITISKINRKYTLYLHPKLIEFDEVEVEAENFQKNYNQDIFNFVNTIDELKFEARGFNEISDILISDQSINVSEEANGTTNISIRGSNSDEVLILFDGIKINNEFTNLFDFSIIDPSNLDRIDIIKGSNSVANGAISHSATINLIPKSNPDYTIKFNQRIGSYNSGDWRANITKKIGNLEIFASGNQGGSTQCYDGMKEYDHILNKKENYLGNIKYEFGNKITHLVGFKYLDSRRTYDNIIYSEFLENQFQLINGSYSIKIPKIGTTSIQYSQKNLIENREFQSTYNYLVFDGENSITDKTHLINIAHFAKFNSIDARISYQNEISDLDYTNLKINTEGNVYTDENPSNRNLHNLLASIQFNNESKSEKFNLKNVKYDLSFELIDDDLQINAENVIRKNWFESSNNLTMNFEGMHGENHISTYANLGISNTIPTLYQQLNYQIYHRLGDKKNDLLPEFKKNIEVGFSYCGKMTGNLGLYQLSASFFRTNYTNKFRMIQISQSPVKYFDNHDETSITGVESSLQIKMFHKKMILDLGAAKYTSPDEMTFSFKADQKISVGCIAQLGNLYGEITWFSESDRIGYVLVNNIYGSYLEQVLLDKFNNLDAGLKYSLILYKQKINFAFSGKNLIKNDETFEGIAIHDRRYYLSIGFEI